MKILPSSLSVRLFHTRTNGIFMTFRSWVSMITLLRAKSYWGSLSNPRVIFSYRNFKFSLAILADKFLISLVMMKSCVFPMINYCKILYSIVMFYFVYMVQNSPQRMRNSMFEPPNYMCPERISPTVGSRKIWSIDSKSALVINVAIIPIVWCPRLSLLDKFAMLISYPHNIYTFILFNMDIFYHRTRPVTRMEFVF